eukprot:scaffold8233_cov46-Cyclotella_meneghiniana.AAC.6
MLGNSDGGYDTADVGVVVGRKLGDAVGTAVGGADGELLGCPVGDPLGSYVGHGVTGIPVGFVDGDFAIGKMIQLIRTINVI